jgi:hypothetical protein
MQQEPCPGLQTLWQTLPARQCSNLTEQTQRFGNMALLKGMLDLL